MMKQFGFALVSAGTALASCLLAASAQAETVLRFNNWLPPTHSQQVGVVDPWRAAVEKATNGRVKVVMTDSSLGAPPRQYDLVVDGVVDLAISIVGYTPGRFKLPPIADLPLVHEDSWPRSIALWNTYKKHFEAAGEFKDVVLLGMYVGTPGSVLTSKKAVTSIADYQGLKLRTGGGMMEDVNQALGGVNVSAPAGQIYEFMSQGVVDGALMGGEGYASFKLKGLVNYMTSVPGGLYGSEWLIIMNKDAWEKLPQEDRDAILTVSGEYISKIGSDAMDSSEAAGRDMMKADGVKMTVADQQFVSDIASRTAFLREKWIADAASLGVDGAAALKFFEDEIARSAAK